MTGEFFSAFSVLFIMLGLLGLTAWAVKKFGLLPGQPKLTGKKKQLAVIDSQMLDARNRLVVVNWRGRDYFLGTGQNGVTLIDSDADRGEEASFRNALAGAEGEVREED